MANHVKIAMTSHCRGTVTIDGEKAESVTRFSVSAGIDEPTTLTLIMLVPKVES